MPNEFTCVLAGECGVGKSTLVKAMCGGNPSLDQESTIGAAYMNMSSVLGQGRHVASSNTRPVCIWDTAGQERYAGLLPMYARRANVALLVYDCTNPETLGLAVARSKQLHCTPGWLKLALLVGNKTDLQGLHIPLKRANEAALEIAEELGVHCVHMRASAYKGDNVDGVRSLLQLAAERHFREHPLITGRTSVFQPAPVNVTTRGITDLPCSLL